MIVTMPFASVVPVAWYDPYETTGQPSTPPGPSTPSKISPHFFGWIAYSLSRTEYLDSDTGKMRRGPLDQPHNLVAVANTPERHNLIVCTLCSCYPWPLLGLPPSWYKSLAYRARAVAEPRAVLGEFGLSEEQGNEIIMAARAHWFEDEDAPEDVGAAPAEEAADAESSQ